MPDAVDDASGCDGRPDGKTKPMVGLRGYNLWGNLARPTEGEQKSPVDFGPKCLVGTPAGTSAELPKQPTTNMHLKTIATHPSSCAA
mmetsp:Transcript_10074/g.27700  ORF Transcript_10074/g.27700 Transcript_10074/m.27700 type:complete len:87 (+) Transcript_10074:298-558(+)